MSSQKKTQSSSVSTVVEGLLLLPSKFKHYEYVLNFFLLLFLIAPGLMVIAYFREDVLFNLDVLKIILLSLTFSMPFIGIYVFVDAFVNVMAAAKMSERTLLQARVIQSRLDSLKSELGKTVEDEATLKQLEGELRAIKVNSRAIEKQVETEQKYPPNHNLYMPLIYGALQMTILTGVFLIAAMLFGRPRTLHQFLIMMLIIGGPITILQAVVMNEHGSYRLKLATYLVLLCLFAGLAFFVRI